MNSDLLPCGPAPPIAIYNDIATGFTACQAHAKANGYAFKHSDSKQYRVVFTCDRAGIYDPRGKKPSIHSTRQRQNTGSKKCDCRMRVVLTKDRIAGKWELKVLEATHNHAASEAYTAHPAHRNASILAETRATVISLARAGLPNAQILSALREEDSSTSLLSKDISNIVQTERKRDLGGRSPIQWLIEELQANDFSPQFYPQSGPLQRLFFIHPTSIRLWKQHSDILLLDCTYKTNRFNMPLLNICGITGNNMVIQLGLVFLSGETARDYTWALVQLRDLMAQHMIQEPISIVTDRELALIKYIETFFPSARHLLCRWHVNMNVLARTKKYFPGPIKDINGNWTRHPRFQAFLSSWNTLLASTTEEIYNASLENLRAEFPVDAVSYCEGTWLLWKEKLVAFWVDQSYHFGVTVTSPIEGCHATLKLYLQRGHADLRGVFLKLQLFWTAQHSGISSAIAQQQLRPRHSTNIPILAAILPYIHTRALQRIVQETSKLPCRGPPPGGCICTTQQAFGLPCLHTLWKRQQEGGSVLLSDIHHH